MEVKEIKTLLFDDKLKDEKINCILSVPERFRNDAYYCLEFAEDMHTIDKAWGYFLEDILPEMSIEEKSSYNFQTYIEMGLASKARDIVDNLIKKNGLNGFTNKEIQDEINSWCFFIEELIDNVYQDIQEREIKIID